MAIPQSFKEKYSLTGENYEKRNVDLALSDLFAASTRLYADNAELRRQIDTLKAERNSLAAQLREAKSAPAPVSESSMTVRKLDEICRRLDALEAKIGANAGVLGEKLAALAEVLSDAVVYTAADDSLSADEEALADAEALEFAEEEKVEEEETDDLSPEAASAAVRTVTVEPTLDFSAPLPVEDEPIEDEPIEEAIVEDAPAVEEEPIAEAPAVEEEPIAEAPAVEEELIIEEETIAEDAVVESDEPSREEIIKAAGLEDEAEDIEPSEPIPDDNVAKMLAALYATPADKEAPATEAADEEIPAEEAPAADTGKVNGMRNSLDAIRRRREMKK